MGSLNRAQLIGNLCADPDVRRLNSGDPVCNLRVATNESWKDKNGQRQERATYHNVVIFNEHLVRVCENYLRKGSKVYVEGSLQTRKWTDQQGVEKFSTEVVLQRFRGELQMLDWKSEGGGGYSEPDPDAGTSLRNDELDDDIPFASCRGIW